MLLTQVRGTYLFCSSLLIFAIYSEGGAAHHLETSEGKSCISRILLYAHTSSQALAYTLIISSRNYNTSIN
jgi:hypothetical protein